MPGGTRGSTPVTLMPTNSVTPASSPGVPDQLLDERGGLAEHLADRHHVARPDMPG